MDEKELKRMKRKAIKGLDEVIERKREEFNRLPLEVRSAHREASEKVKREMEAESEERGKVLSGLTKDQIKLRSLVMRVFNLRYSMSKGADSGVTIKESVQEVLRAAGNNEERIRRILTRGEWQRFDRLRKHHR